MKLIDHINLYFGTEHEDVRSFLIDFKHGELRDDYYDDNDQLSHLLMFLSAYDQALERDSN